MATKPDAAYPGRIAAASADYPYGSARDESVPGADDGTPLLDTLVNEIFGSQQALLGAVGAVPDGDPETAQASQYLDAIRELIDRHATWLGWQLADGFYTELSKDVSAQDTLPRGLSFKPDGLKMYVIGSQNGNVYQYTLGTAWDLGTASYDSVAFSVTAQFGSPSGAFFKPDGTAMYIVGPLTDSVHHYATAKAFKRS